MARSDMFLKATGQRTGEIQGESNDKGFPNQIDVLDWSWGMSAPSSVGGQRAGRTLMKEVRIIKRVDKASTSLMSVMSTNETLKSAVLSVRKAGGASPLAYFTMTLEQARVAAYDVECAVDDNGAPMLRESLSLAFRRITVDHVVQSEQGASRGGSSFSGDVSPD